MMGSFLAWEWTERLRRRGGEADKAARVHSLKRTGGPLHFRPRWFVDAFSYMVVSRGSAFVTRSPGRRRAAASRGSHATALTEPGRRWSREGPTPSLHSSGLPAE